MVSNEILHSLFDQYGHVYLTIFSDTLIIPWNVLSIEDYIECSRYKQFGTMPISEIEEYIFKKYVLDKDIVKVFEYLPAGVISTVSANIWESSFPLSLNQLSTDLDLARAELVSPDMKIYHEMISLILQAFPYKPEEIYLMDYATLMERFSQAEDKLLRQGFLQKPVSFSVPKETKKIEQMKQENTMKAKEYVDNIIKHKTESKTKLIDRDIKPNENHIDQFEHTKKWWKTSPILEADKRAKKNIDVNAEAAEITATAMTGWEKEDKYLQQSELQKRAKVIYKDVLQTLDKQKKASTIKSGK